MSKRYNDKAKEVGEFSAHCWRVYARNEMIAAGVNDALEPWLIHPEFSDHIIERASDLIPRDADLKRAKRDLSNCAHNFVKGSFAQRKDDNEQPSSSV